PPPLCRAARAVQVGTVDDRQADELSGLTVGHAQPDLLWSHNDSGDSARIFALRRDGTVLGTPAVTGAQAVDWEDIASGPAPGGGELLYAGDIGDNAASRSSIDVYRFPEPQPDAQTTAPAARLRLRYPDGAHDAEALLVDPLRHTLVIVTKSIGLARAYSASDTLAGGSLTTLRSGPRVPLPLVTAGDVSGDGHLIALRTYFRLYLWARRGREPLTAALARPATCVVAAPLNEGQGEAVALTRTGSAAYTTAEGTPAIIRRYGT
ncbi:MAG TPA: hypothetical protein VII98_00440, partial [Solirubrobacteraceae bacterium]